MAEHPIAFRPDMVRAILAGAKWQTRRIIKPQPHPDATLNYLVPRPNDTRAVAGFAVVDARGVHSHQLRTRCGQGVVGDTLWIRESFGRVNFLPDPETGHYWGFYSADDTPIEIDYSEIEMGRIKPGKTYPSIHMPRWASRITLEVTGLRVERVGEISEADCYAEGLIAGGVEIGHAPHMYEGDIGFRDQDPTLQGFDCFLWTKGYQKLWDSIHGAKPGYSFADSLWCWIVEFKVVEVRK